jgi:hypothetical protein
MQSDLRFVKLVRQGCPHHLSVGDARDKRDVTKGVMEFAVYQEQINDRRQGVQHRSPFTAAGECGRIRGAGRSGLLWELELW